MQPSGDIVGHRVGQLSINFVFISNFFEGTVIKISSNGMDSVFGLIVSDPHLQPNSKKKKNKDHALVCYIKLQNSYPILFVAEGNT